MIKEAFKKIISGPGLSFAIYHQDSSLGTSLSN